MPTGTAEQVPSLVATPHDWQRPVHAVAQQKPCAQIPELQSLPAAQVNPFGRLPQLVPLHTLGATQSVADVAGVHAALQVALLSQRYGSHAEEVTVWQTPAPLHVRVGVRVEPVQAAATHAVPVT